MDGCYYLKGFPSTHPLHGVFPRPDSEKYKKNQERKASKSYHTDFTSKEPELSSNDILLKLKELMARGKEEAKANLASSKFIPFTSIISLLEQLNINVFLLKTRIVGL